MVLPDTDVVQAEVLGQRVNAALEVGGFHEVPADIQVRCSVGFAVFEDGMSAGDLVARADQAMYAQKRREGRPDEATKRSE